MSQRAMEGGATMPRKYGMSQRAMEGGATPVDVKFLRYVRVEA